ncbi:T9SS type A sorting domain-containing protein [Lentimicrobium sp.]|uniref:T9SS type A sorting domain-containing protein n=1 Tax=Lentimicrobium sp. TaxID=2034841 RepID=UPI002C81DC51|nr:T9SS type A sorting domain-containing protein [Lentimicrobium sp.]HRW69215.1 T9SS type A sorting domain-containing protein [Lentimicrobium sp.]
MKTLIYAILFLFSWVAAKSQSGCFPEGISFAHQYEIEWFQANYSWCTHIEGNVHIFGEDIYSLGGLSGVKSIGGSLYIGDPFWWTNLRNLNGLQGLTYVGGGITLQNNPFLRNIEGLGNVESLGTGQLLIEMNDSLTLLAGLEKITTIEGGVWVTGNHSLLNFLGLSNLTYINRNGFYCENNYLLADFTGLENLKKCIGILKIGINESLVNIDALTGLNEFGGGVFIHDNAALANLDGIANIPGTSISYLRIFNNPLLTKCHVQSVCDRLAYGVGGLNQIENNGPGCADYYEVVHKCESIGVDEPSLPEVFSIIENPDDDFIVIEAGNHSAVYTCDVYDLRGRRVLHRLCQDETNTISKASLSSGIYMLRIQGDGQYAVRKFCKK